MPLANYTTKVPVSRSLEHIQKLLAGAGAESMMIDYEDKEACAITFRISKGDRQLGFRLPADWRKTLKCMIANSAVSGRFKRSDQAKRVAWRIVHDWLRAQLALIETGAAEIRQVFLPYAVTPEGRTFFEILEADEFKQLALPAAR